MYAAFHVHKRGPEFWVVINSDTILTKNYGPHASAALANADADAKSAALRATRVNTEDIDIFVSKFPV